MSSVATMTVPGNGAAQGGNAGAVASTAETRELRASICNKIALDLQRDGRLLRIAGPGRFELSNSSACHSTLLFTSSFPRRADGRAMGCT